tara:strand:+ start:4301 stop:5347 length:1047 start_codon:yes stop_codon:yes gene_type:complete
MKMNKELVRPSKVVEEVGCIFAHPDLKGRRHSNGGVYTARKLFSYNVSQVLYMNNKWHVKKRKPVSDATKYKRFTECQAMCHDLHNLGYKIILPTQLKQKHVKALTHYWEASGLNPATIVQKVSILRIFLTWIGKSDVMSFLPHESMYKEPEKIKRSLVAKEDKSWDKKTDVLELIAGVETEDKFVSRQLLLSHFFGMRVKESMLFRPAMDFDETTSVVHVRRGTKGGRPRIMLVETQEQKALLKELRSFCHDNQSSMIPVRADLGRWIKHYYRVCNRHGISRANGMTPHGLRHGYAHRLYEEKTGVVPAAVSGQKEDMDAITDRIARLLVAEDLGHSRVSISSAYLG